MMRNFDPGNWKLIEVWRYKAKVDLHRCLSAIMNKYYVLQTLGWLRFNTFLETGERLREKADDRIVNTKMQQVNSLTYHIFKCCQDIIIAVPWTELNRIKKLGLKT